MICPECHGRGGVAISKETGNKVYYCNCDDSPDRLYTLLEVAALTEQAIRSTVATVARLTEVNIRLERENYRLRREAGKARILADMRQDLAEFEMSADELPLIDLPALLRRQAE